MTVASGLQMNVIKGQDMNNKYLKKFAFGIYSRRPPFPTRGALPFFQFIKPIDITRVGPQVVGNACRSGGDCRSRPPRTDASGLHSNGYSNRIINDELH
jgi:hypothetical protein